MNRAIIRRWINEYLDGEIGLADKVELEHIMADHPEVREEYRRLRRISLLLGSMPQVAVHPTRFRDRVLDALEAQEHGLFSPQRAFAGAMLVALLVVGLTFGLLLYQEQLLGGRFIFVPPVTDEMTPAGEQAYDLALAVDARPEAFFDRLLIESELGLLNGSMLNPFLAQTGIYEGATCTSDPGLRRVDFPASLPQSVRVKITPRQALTLGNVAEGLTGRTAEIRALGRDGSLLDFKDYLQLYGDAPVYLRLEFR